MKLKLFRGTTSKIVRLFVQDVTKTDGSGLTGLVYNSAGFNCYYIREGDATATAVTLATATVGTYTSGGFKEIDAVNLPGVYEFGMPNAALASGASVIIVFKGAANMAACLIEIELDAVQYQDGAAFGLSRLDVNVSTRNTGNVTVGGYAAGQDPATLTLATPANKLTTNASGNVTVAGNVTVGGYAVGQDPATLTLATPANKLATNASGQVQHDMTQAVPLSNTAHTVGDSFNAARAQGFGKWVLSGTSLIIYASDGTTVVRTFTVDSATNPTQRL